MKTTTITVYEVSGADIETEHCLTEREALIMASVLMRHGHRVKVRDLKATLTPVVVGESLAVA